MRLCEDNLIELSYGTTEDEARLAQSAERKALNLVVVGSSSTGSAFRQTACANKYTNKHTHTHAQQHKI